MICYVSGKLNNLFLASYRFSFVLYESFAAMFVSIA
jgi:hypothetical protein